MNVQDFVDTYFHHFNAAELRRAARAYRDVLDAGGKMLVSLAGAMSTARLGQLLAPMIRQGKIAAISCTGANLEEDLFNLIARKDYREITNYRHWSEAEEGQLERDGYNRITDVAVPGDVGDRLAAAMCERLIAAEKAGERFFPDQLLREIISSEDFASCYQLDPRESWVLACQEQAVPIFVPGWEDSTLGNFYASYLISEKITAPGPIKSGPEYMVELAHWYETQQTNHPMGFFQIGGGIAGDFPICVVPMMKYDLGRKDVPCWQYFCQIGDSTTSYGSYSGAPPQEKISWGKLEPGRPAFMIESDATIAAPLLFAYILEM